MSTNTNIQETEQYKRLRLLVNIISVALPLIVGVLFRFKIENFEWPFNVYFLPLANAVINGTTAVLLILALIAAKQRKITRHTRLIYTAMGLSLVFLLIYVAYHMTAGHVKYGGTGTIKVVYLVILATHIVLAAIQAPFVLYAFLYGYTGQIHKHQKIVKFSYPIWLYVSVTGVICYLMISPYYPQ